MEQNPNRRQLTKTEALVLRLLAKGFTYPQIADRVKISEPNLHSITYRIRRKTKIRHTRDAEECTNYLRGVAPVPFTPTEWQQPYPPTRKSLEAMGYVSLGRTYNQAAKAMRVKPQAVQNYVSQGCARAGITAKGILRPIAIREYLGTLHALNVLPAPADPMNDF